MPRSSDQIDAFVGARIVALRTRSGLSQSQLAAQIGVSFQQVQKYESGANRVSASRLHHLAQAFAAPIESFFPATSPLTLVASHHVPAEDCSEPRAMAATPEGRALAAGFGAIDDRDVRHALAVLVGALSKAA